MDDLKFDSSYFEDSERFGFYLPEMMKRAWASQLKILEELKILLEKYDLRYYADFGTLLGAIRHNGIIPWDDDIDISMPRKDFNILIEHANEIGGGLLIRSIYNTDTFYNFHAVATNSGGYERFEWDDQRMKDYYGCPFFSYVDIFPLDYIYRNPKKYKIQKNIYYIAYKCVYDCVSIEEKYFGRKLVRLSDIQALFAGGKLDAPGKLLLGGFLKNIEVLRTYLKRYMTAAAFSLNDKKIRNQLCRITDKIAQMCSEEEADMIDYCPHMANTEAKLWRRKEWFEESIEHRFENTTIPVPKKYKEVLISRFGENYMVPERNSAAHDYPYYRTMIEVLVGGDTGETYVEYQQKSEILAAIDTLLEGQSELKKKAFEGSYGISRKMLGELQGHAVDIGNAIEARKGEGTWLIEPLEEYCEGLYEFYNVINSVQEGKSGFENLQRTELELEKLIAKARSVIVKGYHRDVPKEWIRRLTKADGERKKVIIYGLSAIEIIGHGKLSSLKIRKTFEEFDKVKEEFCVFLCIPPKLRGLLHRCNLRMTDSYDEVIDNCCLRDFVIVPDIDKLELVVSIGDAYFGDDCPLMEKFRSTGKPIMVQNYMTS